MPESSVLLVQTDTRFTDFTTFQISPLSYLTMEKRLTRNTLHCRESCFQKETHNSEQTHEIRSKHFRMRGGRMSKCM